MKNALLFPTCERELKIETCVRTLADLTRGQAVLEEALRMHPGVACPLKKFVLLDGAVIFAVDLSGGTNVSIPAPVVHMDKAAFGNDAHKFRQEKWIEADQDQLKLRDRSFLAVSRHGNVLPRNS
jgi:cytochrome P450